MSAAAVPASVWTLQLHPAAWAVLLAATALYAAAIRRPAFAVGRRQAWSFLGAIIVLLAAVTWPLADLAAHRLLVALVVQRLLLMLAAPPLLLAGLPPELVARATRPAAIDEVLRFCSRPVPAIVLVTVVAAATLSTPAVDAQASSAAARGGLDAALLVAGVVLWAPVLRPVPGSPRLSALGRAGYLIVQSIVPSFLAVVWIFARHPLYPVYAHAGRTFGMSPLLDQQVAGFVAKLGTIAVLWSVAGVIVHRSERLPEGDDGIPLTWADVQRHLERADRQRRRRRSALPRPPGWGGEPWPGAPDPSAWEAGSPLRPAPAPEARPAGTAPPQPGGASGSPPGITPPEAGPGSTPSAGPPSGETRSAGTPSAGKPSAEARSTRTPAAGTRPAPPPAAGTRPPPPPAAGTRPAPPPAAGTATPHPRAPGSGPGMGPTDDSPPPGPAQGQQPAERPEGGGSRRPDDAGGH